METELAYYPRFYPEIKEKIYAPKYYFPLPKQDTYSYRIVQSKKQDKSNYFYLHLIKTIDEIGKEKILKDLKLITVIPSSKIGKFSATLCPLAKKIASYLNVKCDFIIEKIKETGRKNQEGNSASERYSLIKDSMKINKERFFPKGKIMIIDDVKVTGISILEAKKKLLESGYDSTISLCLGINRVEL